MYQAVQNLEDALGAGTPLKDAVESLSLPKPKQITTDFSVFLQNKNYQQKTIRSFWLYYIKTRAVKYALHPSVLQNERCAVRRTQKVIVNFL